MKEATCPKGGRFCLTKTFIKLKIVIEQKTIILAMARKKSNTEVSNKKSVTAKNEKPERKRYTTGDVHYKHVHGANNSITHYKYHK